MAKCQTCQAPIEWAKSAATGKAMPLDAEPVPDGNIVINSRGEAVVLKKGEEAKLLPETPRFRSHYSTCKQADAWRSGAMKRRDGAKW